MIKYYFILLFIFPFSFLSAQVMFIDAEASEVGFEVKKFKIFNVDGTFDGLKGTIRFDSTRLDQSNFLVCIDVATIDSGNKKRDEHLRSEEFFDAEKYPRICFNSTKFRKEKQGFVVEGVLGIRNQERPVEIPFTFRENEFVGQFKINRKDFEVGKDFSTFTAGNEIEVEIKCKIK